MVIFLVLGGFWSVGGILALGGDFDDFSVFEDFCGVGSILSLCMLVGGILALGRDFDDVSVFDAANEFLRCPIRFWNNCMNLQCAY